MRLAMVWVLPMPLVAFQHAPVALQAFNNPNLLGIRQLIEERTVLSVSAGAATVADALLMHVEHRLYSDDPQRRYRQIVTILHVLQHALDSLGESECSLPAPKITGERPIRGC